MNLSTIREKIQEGADENGIAVAFSEESMKVGGLFSKQVEEYLVMYNPEHANDYLRFGIRLKHQGKYAFMQVYNMGGSKNYGRYNAAQQDGTSGVAASIFNKISGHGAKLAEEENYYTILRDILSNVTGVDL